MTDVINISILITEATTAVGMGVWTYLSWRAGIIEQMLMMVRERDRTRGKRPPPLPPLPVEL